MPRSDHCCQLAGLLVDKEVTHPFEWNFYLNAHVRAKLLAPGLRTMSMSRRSLHSAARFQFDLCTGFCDTAIRRASTLTWGGLHLQHRSDSCAVCAWQAGLQGTNRPALYHVLLDENRLSANDLQQLTYKCARMPLSDLRLLIMTGCCCTTTCLQVVSVELNTVSELFPMPSRSSRRVQLAVSPAPAASARYKRHSQVAKTPHELQATLRSQDARALTTLSVPRTFSDLLAIRFMR